MKKFILIVFIIILTIAGIVFGANAGKWLKNNAKHSVLPAATKIGIISPSPQPTITQAVQTEPGIPQTISIPSIDVTANVESVGLNDKNKMDTPKDPDNVAWFNLGYKPGVAGNAVIAGHLDKVTGAPAVFWNISKLKVGDTITITDDNNNNWTFTVKRIESYEENQFPLQEVFGPSSQPMLNLITCQGTWNAAERSYSHRLVVYSQLNQ